MVLSINGEKIANWDKGLMKLQTSGGKEIIFEIQKQDGRVLKYNITPTKEVDEDGNETYKYGIATSGEREYGFINSLNYAFHSPCYGNRRRHTHKPL